MSGPIMPYESPNIVLVPKKSLNKNNIVESQIRVDQSDQVISANIKTGSTNVLGWQLPANVPVPHSTIFSQNVLVPNSTVYGYSHNVPVPNSNFNTYSQNVPMQNSNVYLQNVVVPTSTVYPQNLVVPNSTVYSQNVLVPNPSAYSQNVAVPNPTVYSQNALVPKFCYTQENFNVWNLWQQLYNCRDANGGVFLADNITGHTFSKPPPDIYGASKDAILTNNNTGGQPILKQPPEMYEAQNAKESVSLADGKTGGQTYLKSPAMSKSEDCDTVKNNKTEGQPFTTPPPEMYGTHNASKNASLLYNNTGGQPISKLPPEIYGAQNAKESRLADGKTGGQTYLKSILKSPAMSKSEDCDTVNNNKTEGQPFSIPPPNMYGTHGASKNASLLYNNTGGQPISKLPPEMYGAQNAKESSLADKKTGGQTHLKSILKSPEKSQRGDCDKVKKRVSWASNYLRSIGSDSRPQKAYWSASRNKIMKKMESIPEKECDQIKFNLLHHSNVKKGDETKIRQPLLKTPNCPLGAGVKPSSDSRTLLTHVFNKNTVYRPNENSNLCNKKLTSPATLGSSSRPCTGLTTGLTQVSDTEITINSNKNTRTTSLLSKDKTTQKSKLDIRRKPASHHTNVTCNSTASDSFKPPINIITNISLNEKISSNNLKILPHNDEKDFNSISADEVNLQKLQHVNKTLGSLNNYINVNSTTMINKMSNVFVKANHAVKALEFEEPVKPIKNLIKVSDKSINKNKMKAYHNEATTSAISKNNQTKVDKPVYTNKNVTSDKHIDKESIEKKTIKLQKELKNVNEQIKEITSKTSKPTSAKEKYKKQETSKVNSGSKSKDTAKIKCVESNCKNFQDKKSTSDKQEHNDRLILKQNCPEQIQRKRRHDGDNDNINSYKTKKSTHSNSPELLKNKQVRRNTVNKTSCPERNTTHLHYTKPENNRDQNNSEKKISNRSKTNIKRSHSPDRRENKRAKHDLSESIELPPRKRFRHNSEGELNNDSKIVKVDPTKSVTQQADAFQLKHPRIHAPESCSENGNESDFDLRSILSRTNSKHYPIINKTFDTHPADQIRENLLITLNLNNDEENTKLTSIPEPSKQLPTPHSIRQSLTPSLSQQLPTPGPSNQSLIPVQPQHSPPPDPSKLKINTKKYKTIQFVINVRCQNEEDSSDESSSDDNNSTDTRAVNENCAVKNSDLSFLDDFNIDEIVNSLRVSNTKRENKQQDIRRNILVKNNECTNDSINKFVQPIVINSEINIEHIKKEIQDEIVSNQASRRPQENAEKNCFSEIKNLASSNCKELDNERSVNSLVTLTNCENETNLIKNIKEEKVDGEKDNLNADDETMDITCEPSFNNDNIYQTMMQITAAASEKVSNNIEGTKKSFKDFVQPIIIKSEIITEHKQRPANTIEPSKNIENHAIDLIQNIKEQKVDEKKSLNIDEQNLVDDFPQTMNQPYDLVSENCQSPLMPCPVEKVLNDIKRTQSENNENINKEGIMPVLSIADIEEVLEKLDSKVLPNSRDTVPVPKRIVLNKMCEVSAPENTSAETHALDRNIQEVNNNEKKTFKNEVHLNKDKVNDIKTLTEILAPTEDEPGKNSENTKENRNTLSNNNNADTTIVKIDNLTKENRVLANTIEIRVFQYLQKEFSVVSLIRQGTFSKVFKYKDNNSGQHYAIKILTKESSRHSLGVEKEKMLTQLQKDIPKMNLNIVYIINGFGIERTWCFLMDYYPKNLEQALRDEVFSIGDVQKLARQLVTAVMILRNKNIVHSDIKPSHILLDESSQTLKVCGFDSSYYARNVQLLPNIGSLRYRAPEVILGFSAGFGIDVWATALVIYEMTTRKQLFHGSYNNDVLYEQMCLQGSLPYDMVQASRYATNHFIGESFIRRSGFMGMNVVILNKFFKLNSIWSFLLKSYRNHQANTQSKEEIKNDLSKLSSMNTLLEQMLILDPRQRIPIEFVYADPFILTFT